MNPLKLFSRKPVLIKIQAGPFKGAKVYLNPADSKRKIFGLYENVLNPWLKAVVPGKDFAFDVGANDGYDTYGIAHLMSRANTRRVRVFAFEPGAQRFPGLLEPKDWDCYRSAQVEIIPRFVGEQDTDSCVRLDTFFDGQPELTGAPGLVKIDVEGHEIDVLRGARSILKLKNIDWLIEIHGRERIAPVAAVFAEIGRPFLIQELKPLPFIGKEKRSLDTVWLTTFPEQ